MDPAAARLAADHTRLAIAIGRRHHYPDDPGLGESVALEALCHAAQLWTDRHMTGTFPGWASRHIRGRLIDEYRRRYGRRVRPPRPVSLDTTVGDGLAIADTICTTDPEPIDVAAYLPHLKRLTCQQLTVLGLLYEGRTLAQVGAILGVTESRVWQVRRRIRGELAELDAA